ncbi:MAG TPA: PadR family transcriptional regulator, partial [Rubrobacter sp.]|nr:PadR family transcriptional regulator [Rubrobacter sp.]
RMAALGPGSLGFWGDPRRDPRIDPRTGRPMRGFGPRRTGQGDVRAAIIALLSERPMHGYQLIQEIGERTGGLWRPSPGSVYPALQQLEDEGLIVIDKAEGRKVARLTEAGSAHAEERRDELQGVWEASMGGVDEGMFEMSALARQVFGAAMHVAVEGSEAQAAEAQKVLADAKRRLYGILSRDEPSGDEGGRP